MVLIPVVSEQQVAQNLLDNQLVHYLCTHCTSLYAPGIKFRSLLQFRPSFLPETEHDLRLMRCSRRCKSRLQLHIISDIISLPQAVTVLALNKHVLA